MSLHPNLESIHGIKSKANLFPITCNASVNRFGRPKKSFKDIFSGPNEQ